jgi:putative tryptophan/tyrosine transport system substrate-binding protein
MNRRRFSLELGGALLLAPAFIRAQRPMPRIAVALSGTEQSSAYVLEALKRGMRDQGYPEASVEYDVRYAHGQIPLQDRIVAELLARRPDVIVVSGSPFVRAARKATRTIPIVMAQASDPVGNKFIDSLPRPGGNVTGIANLYEAVLPKIAETLHALVPSALRVAVLLNENNPSTAAFWQSTELALRTLGKTALRMTASSEAQIVDAFDRMGAGGVQATIVVPDQTFIFFKDRIAALALARRIAAAYAHREDVLAGGLVSYGPSISGNYRASARYVAQILRGTKPADLPVEQSSRFELVINRKTADSLGIRMPASVVLRADEMIE